MIFNEPIDPHSQPPTFTAVSSKVFVILTDSRDICQKAVAHILFYTTETQISPTKVITMNTANIP